MYSSNHRSLALQVEGPAMDALVGALRAAVDVKRVQRDGGNVLHLEGVPDEERTACVRLFFSFLFVACVS